MKLRLAVLPSAALAAAFLVSCASSQHSASSSSQLDPAISILGVSEAHAEEVLGAGEPADPAAVLAATPMNPAAKASAKLRVYDRGGLLYSILYVQDVSIFLSVSSRDHAPLSGKQLASILRCTAGGASWTLEAPASTGYKFQWGRSDGHFHAVVMQNGGFMATPTKIKETP
jgi:hypothetical protein